MIVLGGLQKPLKFLAGGQPQSEANILEVILGLIEESRDSEEKPLAKKLVPSAQEADIASGHLI